MVWGLWFRVWGLGFGASSWGLEIGKPETVNR